MLKVLILDFFISLGMGPETALHVALKQGSVLKKLSLTHTYIIAD